MILSVIQGFFLQRRTQITILVGSCISSFMWDAFIHPCPSNNEAAVDVGWVMASHGYTWIELLIHPCHHCSKYRSEKVALKFVNWSLAHCNDVMWVQWCFNSPETRLFAQQLAWLTTRKTLKSAKSSLCQTVTGGLPSLRASITESVTMLVRRHVFYCTIQNGVDNWPMDCKIHDSKSVSSAKWEVFWDICICIPANINE